MTDAAIDELGAGLPAEARDYPVRSAVRHQEEYRRFLPLVKWLLLIPHLFVLLLFAIAALFAAVVAFFSVLFTRRYPRGCFNLVTGVMRYSWRINAYANLMTDAYPPFGIGSHPEHPARFEVAYPEQGIDRWRAPFAWIVAIPFAFLAGLAHSLTAAITFAAFFTILFTRRYPRALFDLAIVPMRWQGRIGAYAYFMVDRHPPLVWG